jgi:hypothetical protein
VSRFLSVLLINDIERQELNANVGKAFDLAQDASKQVLTISAGIVVVTITFFDDFGAHSPHIAKILMAVAWGIYLISMISGIFFLFTLAGNLQGGTNLDIYHSNSKTLSLMQVIAFLAAVLITIIAGGITWL